MLCTALVPAHETRPKHRKSEASEEPPGNMEGFFNRLGYSPKFALLTLRT
jgi:hypothetical protein